MSFYSKLKEEVEKLIKEYDLRDSTVVVKGKALKPDDAIGNPQRRDFPLLKGKEVLMEADFLGRKGQAFTDQPGNIQDHLGKILELPLKNNWERAVFISTLNALMRYLGKADKTIHCRNEEPEKCAAELVNYLKENHRSSRIGLVGLQPAMLDQLRHSFDVRVLDLDPDNIGKTKYGVLIEDGEKNLNEVLNWAEVLLVTGSTVVNGTIVNFWQLEKPVVFYGTTIAGPAKLLGLERFCYLGK